MKNKGKVYPSDSLSILNLLPAAILALTALLSQEEQQVLAYMITRSINSTTFSKTNKNKKPFNTHNHNPPLFHCECFHCYTTYWFKWDSSPNRELIHQAIEAFEDHLNNNTQQPKKKAKKRDKTVRKTQTPPPEPDHTAAAEVQSQSQSESEVTVGAGGTVTAVSVNVGHQKGLARRVLPDVLGLLNSRWWSLWSPNV